MAIEKYICHCGNKVNKITSYFKGGVRVTLCDDCANQYGFDKDKDVIKVDYKEVQEDPNLQIIDTREKQ